MSHSIIPAEALNQHVAVLGKTRSGKSSVMRGLVENLLDQQKPVCIIDPKGDWWGIKLAKDGKRAGYPVVIFGGAHADVPINAHAGAHVAELFATDNRPCLIDLGGWMVGERTRFYIDFASTLFRLTKGMRWLVIDEIHNFAPKGKIMDPDAGKALHWTNRLASEGLGKGVSMLFASQRPQKVHNDTLTSAETLVAMRVLHPSDRGAVSDWVKGCGDVELGNKVLQSLAQMDRGEGWVWSPEIGFGPKRVKFPMFKTYDSFRPQTAEDTASLKGWASVDLDDVKAKLATVVKEAEANDPAVLRKRIVELEREAKGKVAAKVATPVVDKVALAAEFDRGYTTGATTAISEVRKRVKVALSAVHGAVAGIVEEGLGAAAGVFNVTTSSASRAPAGAAQKLVHMPSVRGGKTEALRQSKHVPLVPPPNVRASLAAVDGSRQEITGPGQRILDGIAFMESIGVDEPAQNAVAFLAGYTGSSNGAYKNPRAVLASMGLVRYASGDRIALTDAGRAVADSPASAPSREELHRRIYAKLPGPEQKILAYLIDASPGAVLNDECAEQTGYTNGRNGAYKNPRARLRTWGLIEYPGNDTVRAADLLFPDR